MGRTSSHTQPFFLLARVPIALLSLTILNYSSHFDRFRQDGDFKNTWPDLPPAYYD
jgi:hypothetical protein